MNSKSERKSWEELVSETQKSIQSAGKATPCVTVTERNWSALLSALQQQTLMLKQVSEQLQTLACEEDLVSLLENQIEIIAEILDGNRTQEEELQENMELQSKKFSQETSETAAELRQQAGRISEKFGQRLSEQQDRMRKFTTKAFWISLIPTAMILIWCLVRQIWFTA